MSHFGTYLCEQVLTALRRIIRSVDLHSHNMVHRQGITTPQILIMRELRQNGEMTAGALAQRITSGQATLTGILDRLEIRGWIARSRSPLDKRRVQIRLTQEGDAALDRAPAPLQDRFIRAFERLPDWEQHQIVASLQKIAALMEMKEDESDRFVENDSEIFKKKNISVLEMNSLSMNSEKS